MQQTVPTQFELCWCRTATATREAGLLCTAAQLLPAFTVKQTSCHMLLLLLLLPPNNVQNTT
jgi:hypothetical protein